MPRSFWTLKALVRAELEGSRPRESSKDRRINKWREREELIAAYYSVFQCNVIVLAFATPVISLSTPCAMT